MNHLIKTATVLIAVLAIFLVCLLAVLACVICFRRRFLRRSLDGSEPSKELLQFCFFFCRPRHNQSRVEPAAAPPVPPTGKSPVTLGDDDIESSKWQMGSCYLYGPSRLLFTIKEEETEGLGAESIICSTKADLDQTVELARRMKVSLEECFKERDDDDDVVVVTIENDVVEAATDADDNHYETTPFATPSASPVYFTPTASPVHDDIKQENP